jgi:hypothetical protein
MKCQPQCPPSVFAFDETHTCQASCSAMSRRVILNGQDVNHCYETCPLRTFLDGQSCIDCDESCRVCVDTTPVTCTSCNDGYYWTPNEGCATDCPNAQYQWKNKANSKNVCEYRCPSGSYKQPATVECVDVCEPTQLINMAQLMCVSTCPTNSYLEDKKCV